MPDMNSAIATKCNWCGAWFVCCAGRGQGRGEQGLALAAVPKRLWVSICCALDVLFLGGGKGRRGFAQEKPVDWLVGERDRGSLNCCASAILRSWRCITRAGRPGDAIPRFQANPENQCDSQAYNG